MNREKPDLIIITPACEDPYLISYIVSCTLPLFFFIFFIFFFLPVIPTTFIKNLEFKDYNTLGLLRTRVLALMSALISSALIYTQLYKYYPCVIVFSDSTPLSFDPLVYYSFMFLIYFFLALCQLIYRYKQNIKKEEIIYLAFFMFASLTILFQFHLMGIFLCLELFSLSSYLLVAGLGRKISIEAAIKYSLIGLLGTVFFIMGMTFCLLNYGTLNLYTLEFLIRYEMIDFELKNSLDGLKYLAFCGSFFLISLFLKLGIAPFHFWILDVYKGVSPVTFIWLITISKLVLIYILIIIFENLLYFPSFYYRYIFLGLSVSSIIIGSIGGLTQNNLKGLFAYSSIVTVGFVLLPFTSYFYQPRIAITLALSYLVVYIFNLFSFFFFLSKIKHQYLLFNNLFKIDNIIKSNPLLCIGLVISLFSFMGLPPLLGFFPKIFILNDLFQEEFYITVAICIICTLFTSFYYFLIIKRLCFSKTKTYLNYKPFTFVDYIIIFFLICVNVFFIFFFDKLLDFISILF